LAKKVSTQWLPSSETGTEGSSIALGTISNFGTSITISGIPVGDTITDGHNSFTATTNVTSYNVSSWNLFSLSIITTSDTNFTLTATGTNGSASEIVSVDPLAPKVSWAPGSASGAVGTSITLGAITDAVQSLPGDTNSIKSLVSAIPVGATLSDGHGHSFTSASGHTSVNVLTWTLSNLTLVSSSVGNFTLAVQGEPKAMTEPLSRFPAPWHTYLAAMSLANGQAIAWVYARDTVAEAMQAKVLTKDEARRIAVNIARLPELLR
jgi:hypothetical protein